MDGIFRDDNKISNTTSDKTDLSENISSSKTKKISPQIFASYPPFEDISSSSPLSKEDIEKHSLVDDFKGIPDQIFYEKNHSESEKTYLTLNIIANFFGGGLATDDNEKDSLSGLDHYTNFSTWHWLFEDLIKSYSVWSSEEKLVLKEIYAYTEQLKEQATTFHLLQQEENRNNKKLLSETAFRYSEKIQNLKRGESFLLVGGYLNQHHVGHSIIYEVFRRDDHLFDVKAHMSTFFELAESAFKGNKIYVNPLVLFQGIPEKDLFLNEDSPLSSLFVQSLMEVTLLTKWSSAQIVGNNDIIEIFNFFFGKYLKTNRKSGFITGQRSGNCAPASFKAWLRNTCVSNKVLQEKNIDPILFYKKVIFFCKLSLFGNGFQSLKNKIHLKNGLAEKILEVFRMAGPNFPRTVEKVLKYVSPFINEKQALEALATSSDIFKRLDLFAKEIQENKAVKCLPLELVHIDSEKQRNVRAKTPLLPYIPRQDSKKKINADVPYLKKIDTVNDFHEYVVRLEEKTNKTSIAFLIEIQHCIDQLPLPQVEKKGEFSLKIKDKFWTYSSSEEIVQCLEDLKTTFSLYKNVQKEVYKNVKQHPNLGKVHASCLTLYTLVHYFALKMDEVIDNKQTKKIFVDFGNFEGSLSSYQVPNFAISTTGKHYNGLIYFSRSDFSKVNDSRKYFELFNKSASIGTFFSHNRQQVANELITNTYQSGYLKHLIARDSQLHDVVQKMALEKWTDLTSNEIETIYKQKIEEYDEHVKICNIEEKYYCSSCEEIPKHQQNLEKTTKLLMVLASTSWPKTDTNYNFFHIYREMYYELESLIHNAQWCSKICIEPSRFDLHNSIGNIIFPWNNSEHNWKPSIEDKRFNDIQSEHFNFLIEPRFSRDINEWKQPIAESLTLDEKEIKTTSSIIKKVLRTLSEWKIAPTQILLELENHFEEMKDPSFLHFLIHCIFRSPFDDNQIYLGAGELIVNQENFVIRVSEFIQQSFEYFYESKSETSIFGAIAVYSITFLFSKYLQEAEAHTHLKRLDMLPTIEEWLLEKKSISTSSFLHFYRILLYSTSTGLQSKDWSKVYLSWMAYHFHRESRIPLYEYSAAQEFVLSSLANNLCLEEEKFVIGLCHNIIKELDLYRGSLSWKRDDENKFTFLGYVNEEDQPYFTIDLAGGRIYALTGEIRYVDLPTLKCREEFIRLFGIDSYKILSLGEDILSFIHPLLGEVRIVNCAYIQRKFPNDDKWYQLMTPLVVDEIFIKDHCFWVPIEKMPVEVEHLNIKGYFTTLKDDRRVYALLVDGKIIEVEASGKPKKNFYIIDTIDDKKIFKNSRIDKHIFIYRNSEKEDIAKLCFPRIFSFEGNILSFSCSNLGMLWDENKRYVLTNFPDDLLGKVTSQCLYLSAEKTERKGKILIPVGEFRGGELSLHRRPGDVTEAGTFSYVVCDVVEDEIKPLSLEALLMLVYILISQKKYVEAMKYLNDIRNAYVFTPLSQNIISWILKFPLQNDHPDGKAIILKSYFLSLNFNFSEIFLVNENLVKIFLRHMESYLRSQNDVTVHCALSQKEIFEIIFSLLPYKNLMRTSFLYDYINHINEEHKIHEVRKKCKKIIEKKSDFLSKLRVDLLREFDKKNVVVNEITIEETEKNYKERIDRYIKRNFSWLEIENIENEPLTCLRPLNFENDQKILFKKVVAALKSDNFYQKRELLFIVQSWSLFLPEGRHQTSQYLEIMTQLLCFALPERCEFNNGADAEKNLELLCGLLDSCIKNEGIKKFNLYHSEPQKNENVLDRPITLPRINTSPLDIQILENDKKVIPKLPGNEKFFRNLMAWKDLYVDHKFFPNNRTTMNFSLEFKEEMLSKEEVNLKEALIKDLKNLNSDYEIGVGKCEKEETQDIPQEIIVKIQTQAQELNEDLILDKQKRLQNLLSKGNKRPKNDKEILIESSRYLGKKKKYNDYNDFLDCLRDGCQRRYLKINPYLTSEEIDDIAQNTLEILELEAQIAQLNRIISICEEIWLLETNDITRQHFCFKLDHELRAGYALKHEKPYPLADKFEFPDEFKITLKIFSGRLGLLPNERQLDIISRMLQLSEIDFKSFKDLAVQFVPGGGKTRIIGTLIFYTIAKMSQHLGLFIIPSSLSKVVLANLTEDIFKAFNQEIICIDVTREDLSDYRKVKKLLINLKKGINDNVPIFAEATSLQCIEGEGLSLLRKTKSGDCSALIERAEALAECYQLISQKGVALLDEADKLLDDKIELNLPEGPTVPMPMTENNLLLEIYRNILINPKIKIQTLGNQSIKDIIRLESNQQALMDTNIYKTHLIPVITQKLIEKYKPLKFIQEYKDSCIKFITGTLPVEIQDLADDPKIFLSQKPVESIEVIQSHTTLPEKSTQETPKEIFPSWKEYASLEVIEKDTIFLRKLNAWYHSDNEIEKNNSNFICLIYHVLNDVLPFTLTKSAKKDYGVDPKSHVLRIIPYIGVNEPALTKFGYHLVETCCYYQYLCYANITKA